MYVNTVPSNLNPSACIYFNLTLPDTFVGTPPVSPASLNFGPQDGGEILEGGEEPKNNVDSFLEKCPN